MGRKRTAEEMRVRRLAAVEAAYVAGVIDGEGTITLTANTGTANRPNRYTARLQIANTDLGLLARINEMVGGGRFDGKNHREGNKTCYALTWTPTQMRQILPQVLPHLVAKRGQAEAVLRYFDLVDAGAKGAEEASLPEIEAIRREVKRRNHRGSDEQSPPEWELAGPFVLRRVFREKCEHCGEPLDVLMPHKRFCSARCQTAHYQQEVRGPQKKAALVHEQVCKGCGTTFTTDYKAREFCSRPCYLRYRRAEQAKERRETRACAHCGKPFEWTGGKKRYCSASCVTGAYEARKKLNAGDAE